MKTIIRVLSISALMAAQTLSVSHASPQNISSPLGINTNEAMDINSSMPFVDLFKMSTAFEQARPWLTKGKITYDKDGWPKNLNGGQAGARFVSNLPANTIPVGLYTVIYKGEGKLTYGADAKLVSHTKGKDIIRIKPGKNGRISATVTIKDSNPSNYLRDIRILLPGGICEGDAFKRVNEARQCGNRKFLSFEQHHKEILFNPDYLHFMKDFKVIRFMNMSGITRNDLSRWDKRPQMTHATWGGKEGIRGVPLEAMVKLANKIGANPWFNLPHKADNQFVTHYAKYVKDNLNPSLKPYIEYTNEAWNGIFSQHHHMIKMGQKLRLDKNKLTAGSKYYSRRSVEIFKIWEGIYGANKNIVRVMGAFTTNKGLSKTLLSYQDAYKHTDALAIAPYFYIDQKKEIYRIRSVDSVFKKLVSPNNRYSIPNILKHVKAQSLVAKKYKVSLIAYEGGQHLVAYKTKSVRDGPNRYLIYANKDKRMAELYYTFLKGWQHNGGELFVAFSAPRIYTWHGSWGIKEYITQPAKDAPKYRALLAFNKNEPCWWAGCKTPARSIPNTVVAAVSPTKKSPATKRKLGPLDFDSAPLPKHQVGHANTDFSFNKVKTNRKATVRPLKDVVTETVAKVSGTWGAKRHQISKVRDVNRIFSRHSNFRLMNVVSGNINDSRDLGANWQAHWDRQNLHIRVDVNDDKFVKDSKVPWGDDSIEIFIDADGSRLSSYDNKNDFQFMYRWKDYHVNMGQNSPRRNTSNVQHKMVKTRTGYVLETSIPWKLLGIHPSAGHSLGIDVHINDDDDGSERDGKLAWNTQDDNSWSNPQSFGQLILTE